MYPFNRNGYYIITPEDRILSECKFVAAFSEPPLEKLQELVEGWIECIRVKDGGLGIVNEEGKIKGFSVNPLATVIYGNPRDEIVGTMVILCGRARLR